MILIKILLALAAIYSAAMWLIMAVIAWRTQTDYECETFHLGLCAILAAGFLGLLLK